nr:hypothetical protein [Candidatus Sigynarchaeota archaeon]
DETPRKVTKMGQVTPEDIARSVIQTTPDLKLENPPRALFAAGSERHVDLFGELSILALISPSQLVIFDPVEVRQSQGVFDNSDILQDQDQIEDIKFIKEEMQTEDPEKLRERVTSILTHVLKKKLLLHGILELEANAFGSSIFMNVEPQFINKLEAMHKHFRTEEEFPEIQVIEEKQGLFKQRQRSVITMRFVGRYGTLGRIWPKQDDSTGKAFEINLQEQPSSVSGLVVVDKATKVAEFIILSDNITAQGGLDWLVIKSLLEDFKLKKKSPICWFRWQLGFTGLYNMYGFESVRLDPRIQTLIQEYNQKVENITMDFYRDESVVGTEKQVKLDRLRGEERDAAIEDLKEAMAVLDKWYEETSDMNQEE